MSSKKSQALAKYIIAVETDGKETLMAGPLAKEDHDYFVHDILPHMRELTDNDYMHGPAVILHTLARFSYILYQKRVYWCSEWDPGLIVVRLFPDGTMESALRSPMPDFGRRKPKRIDLADYDEDAGNHQYNLVFRAWDAQFDKDWRRWGNFKPADAKTAKEYRTALKHVDVLGEQLQARYSAEAKFDRWTKQCKRNLTRWAGEGLRVRL